MPNIKLLFRNIYNPITGRVHGNGRHQLWWKYSWRKFGYSSAESRSPAILFDVSLVLLNYFNARILVDSIEIKRNAELSEENDGGEGEGVVASLVLIFAGLGLVIDGICLAAYYRYAKKDAEFEYQEMIKLAEAEGKNLE